MRGSMEVAAVFLAAWANVAFARNLPPFSALKSSYPGHASQGGLYTDDNVMLSVKAENRTINNTCALRISIMLNFIPFHQISSLPKGLNDSQYHEMIITSAQFNTSMYFMLDNEALMAHMNRVYGQPLVSSRVEDFKNKLGIMLISMSDGRDNQCGAVLWDGYGFFQARAFLRYTNMSAIYFWQTPDEPCSIVQGEKSESLLCFPSAAQVELDSGERVAMSELRIGDAVKTTDKQGEAFYTKVVTFLQREPSHLAKYYTLMTESGAQVTMTESHLIFTKNLQVSSNGLHRRDAVYAARVRPGDYVYVQTPGEDTTHAEKVVGVALGREVGAFAPVTAEGTMLVNGVLVSCFADISDHDLANSLMSPLRSFYSMAPHYLGSGGTYLHKYLKVVLRPVGIRVFGEEKFYKGPFEEYAKKN